MTYRSESIASMRTNGSQVSGRHYGLQLVHLKYSSFIKGKLDFGVAPGCSPISAFGYGANDGSTQLHVYWRNLQDEIVGTKNTTSWGSTNKVLSGLRPGAQFAAAQWGDGKHLRLYYQNIDDSVLEVCSDGESWFDGAEVAKAR